jgi:hypothetical protein
MRVTPKAPMRADHRFLQNLTKSILGGKVEPTPKDFDLIDRAFKKGGGSWMRIFRGSIQDIEFIKKLLKLAHKKGLLTKKSSW